MPDQDGTHQPNRNDYAPAKTDEPFTEALFGPEGVRVIHFITYTLAFGIATLLFSIVYASVRTIILLAMNSVGLVRDLWGTSNPIEQTDVTITMLFSQSILDPRVVGAAIFTSILVTSLIFYWNEIRYERGEWLRTFL